MVEILTNKKVGFTRKKSNIFSILLKLLNIRFSPKNFTQFTKSIDLENLPAALYVCVECVVFKSDFFVFVFVFASEILLTAYSSLILTFSHY